MAPTIKVTATSRQRQPSTLSQVHTPPSTKPKKTNKPSQIVILKLQPSVLGQFESASATPEPIEKKKPTKATSTTSISTPTVKFESEASNSVNGTEDGKPNENKENSEATAAKAGVKRKLDADENGEESATKAQRKRPKVGEGGRMDGRTAAAKAAGYNPAAHKLGPKSNMGVINEKLRALDRTSKPCRKWGKRTFQIKSFTGRTWQLPSWKTPQSRMFGEEAESQDDSSNELSKANSSSQIGSDQSPAGENGGPSSSPVRIAPAPIKA